MSVTRRLLAACAVTAGLAVVVGFASGGGAAKPSAAAPAFLAVGTVSSALVAYLLYVSARAVWDARLTWMAAGTIAAFLGLLIELLGEGATTATYVAWHAAFAGAAIAAVRGVRPTRRRVLAFLLVATALLAGASLASDGYAIGVKLVATVVVAAQGAAAVAWWRQDGGAPAWGAMCIIAALALSTGDGLASLLAEQPYRDAWWASLTLRAGQFAIPAVGLVMGFVAFADKLRELQDALRANLEAERERGEHEDDLAHADRNRRERLAAGIRRLIAGDGLDVALQPIVDLDSHQVLGAEALARFTAGDGTPIPTEECFRDAHALGLGIELELAAIRLALAAQGRLPEGSYLALNASPALLAGDELLTELTAHRERPIVVELTEHQPVEDYAALGAALERLRAHGIRVAIDDVGSGFSSFRHVTRVNPEILKLDRTLVCGIDDDPVRQSLASAIVAFAEDVGATVVSEGIESEAELACLRELAVGCGQGFLLARPHTGAVRMRPLEPAAVA